MAKEFSYKRTTTPKLQAVGMLDTDTLRIDVEGRERQLDELLQDFNGATVTLTVQVKEEEEIEE